MKYITKLQIVSYKKSALSTNYFSTKTNVSSAGCVEMHSGKRRRMSGSSSCEGAEAEKRRNEDVSWRVFRVMNALDAVGPPPGWYGSGPRGPKEVFDWKAMTVLLTLMFYWGMTFREMTLRLERDEWLLKALGVPRAPAKSTLQKARARIPTSWLEEVGEAAQWVGPDIMEDSSARAG